jgi:hypothetical protein
MMDLSSSPLLLEAQLAERRREISAAKASAGPRIHHPNFRAALADLLAHLALHLDRRAVGVVVGRHANTTGR